ncbi:hypothetical protein H5410_015902 [Solanum commersonii]|uniref:Uncharacterized protein n=1 Tax=Solanum commersonii TaxID=4109 RepID=A0A9J5ZUY8_SOLCO|nr:hypothetical protein H5410_015902 [Solanum commersonii]
MTRSMWAVVAEKAAGVVHASLLLLKLVNVVVHAAITSRIAAASYDVELKIDDASGVFNAGQLLGSFEQRFGPGMGLKKWAGRTLESVGI